ncbi:addiction module toxin RelE [Veillonella sp. T14073-2]|uniref:type II toxin-antitoxin system RelE/ParE family toxin n=1 Tax=Veillonella sp. T14073-2 TaxID=1911680 RepID=UPI000CF4156A|nr:type II toxin-antitoxin system RelE/ParE family toxin [Veillonella sp. T14073-2]PQL20667.1 addiction module toxin RelE [Veillonella sp. T14073-2]
MEKPKFISYTRPNGHNEFEEFYNSLPVKDRNKLRATIEMIEEAGIQAAIQLEWVKKLDSEINEIRSKVSSNIQRALYFHVKNNQYIITHGFTKKTQKTPIKEIERAKQIKYEFEEEYYATKNIR